MKRAALLFLFATILLPAGCGRGENVVLEKKPAAKSVEVDAKVEPETAEAKAARLQSFRESAEKIELQSQESKTAEKNRGYSINMMWAATAWLKAEDHPKALAAAKAAIAAGPDDRNATDTFKWHTNIADVLAATGEIPLAIEHYELALKSAPDPISQSRTEKKLGDLKGKLGERK